MTSLGEQRPVSLHPKIGGQWEDEPRILSMHHHLLTNTGNSPGDDTMYSRILVTNSWCCRTTNITEVKVPVIFTNIYLWQWEDMSMMFGLLWLMPQLEDLSSLQSLFLHHYCSMLQLFYYWYFVDPWLFCVVGKDPRCLLTWVGVTVEGGWVGERGIYDF